MPVLELSAKIPQHEGRDDKIVIKRKVFEIKKSEKFVFFLSEVKEIRRRVQSLESRWWDDDEDKQ